MAGQGRLPALRSERLFFFSVRTMPKEFGTADTTTIHGGSETLEVECQPATFHRQLLPACSS